ncbi:MAG: septation protein A [Alphaproteobacteria bacterium]
MNKNNNSSLKFLYDYLPIIIFFVCYKYSLIYDNLLFATLAMLWTSFIAISVCYFVSREVPKVATFSALLLGIFCGLSIFFNDEYFIKVKPTIINLIFGFILFYGYFFKKPMLSLILGEQIKISHEDWLVLSLRWGVFFVGLAFLNEVIWRNFSTDFWVKFKIFGMMTITMAFTISQIPFLLKAQAKFNQIKL